jgi:hypothetical protein
MKHGIRLAVLSGLAIAFAGAPTYAIAQDDPVGDQSADSKTDEGVAPGAAAMEPEQALIDDPAYEISDAHQAWLDSIWNSP